MFDAEKKAYWNQRETLLEKYEGRWVAIVNDEVAAVGEKNTEVMLEAFRKTGCKVMYVNKVGHEKTALRKRIRQYTTGNYDEEFDPPMPMLSAIVMDMIGLLQKPVHFIIDTGADITVLEEHTCTQLGIRDFPVAEAEIAGIGEQWERRRLYGAFVELISEQIAVMLDCRGDIRESILGRDVINEFEFVLNGKDRTVVVNPA